MTEHAKFRDPNWMPPKPEPLPAADKVKDLLDAGKRDEAYRYAKAYNVNWFELAEKGELLNLTDLLAVNDEILVDHHTRSNDDQ